MAFYPASKFSRTNRVDNTDLVVAADVNVVYAELSAIETDLLGAGAGVVDGLNKPQLVSTNSTFTQGTTVFTGGLRARLTNIEAGLYTAYNDRIGGNGNGFIHLTSISDLGLTIRGAAYSAVITIAKISASNKKSVTFTTSTPDVSNKLAVGQLVNILGAGLTGDNAVFKTKDNEPLAISAIGSTTVGGVSVTTFTVLYKFEILVPAAGADITLTSVNALVSQTANLQEWSTYDGSTETVVASVSADGSFAAKSIWGGDAAGTTDPTS